MKQHSQHSQHSVTLKLGTSNEGLTARFLLQTYSHLKDTQIPCPLCDQMIPVPETLEQRIKTFAAQHGGDTAYILVSFSHPSDQPMTKQPAQRHTSVADVSHNMVHDLPPIKPNSDLHPSGESK